MVIACTGYIDLSLTEYQFRDMIEKEMNGELTCIGSNKTNIKNLVKNEQVIRKTRHITTSPGFFEEMVFSWNCSYAAEVLNTCYNSVEKIKSLGTVSKFSLKNILPKKEICTYFFNLLF